jgi:site-specific DNA-methyltransferase (adenine-specific)
MPNTFAMAPRYVARYITRHRLRAPQVDVLAFLEARLKRFSLPVEKYHAGRAWRQDVRLKPRWPARVEPAKLIFTSPPYLGVMRYAKLNWIRHWLLGNEPEEIDSRLFSSGSLDRYTSFMSTVLRQLRGVLRDDGFVCLVIGDVRRSSGEVRLAQVVAESCIAGSGLRMLGMVSDRVPVEHKVSRIWGKTKGRATKTDRILILGAQNARLPRQIPATEWAEPLEVS